MYKKVIKAIFFSIALVAMASPAWADKPGIFGIGIGAGTISNGLSGKYYMPSFAIQANVGTFGSGSARYDVGGFALSADALIENDALFRNEFVSIDWNFGAGAGLGIRNDVTAIAVAGVLGIEFNFVPIPLDLVLEYRPTLVISPSVDLEPIDFTGHLRFYFQ